MRAREQLARNYHLSLSFRNDTAFRNDKPSTYRLLPLLHVLQVFRRAVAAEQLWQILRESRARDHHVGSGFHGLDLEVALHVREEADDGCFLFNSRRSLGMVLSGLAAALFRSKMMSEGFSSPLF